MNFSEQCALIRQWERWDYWMKFIGRSPFIPVYEDRLLLERPPRRFCFLDSRVRVKDRKG